MHNIRIPPSRPKCDKKTIRVGTDMIDKNKLMYICTVTFPTPFIKYSLSSTYKCNFLGADNKQ